MARISIRRAEPGDLEALRAVYRRASLSNVGDRAGLLDQPELLVFAPDRFDPTDTLVAVADGAVIGFVTITGGGPDRELDDLFVDPSWMRQGVATRLMERATEAARTTGTRRIEVTANDHALEFYRSVGFVTSGKVDTLLGPGLRMSLEIGAPRTQ